jgi:hypothetical protein
VARTTTTAAIVAKHVPETDMEAEVAALLEAAGAHSARAVAEAEEALSMKVGGLGGWSGRMREVAAACNLLLWVMQCRLACYRSAAAAAFRCCQSLSSNCLRAACLIAHSPAKQQLTKT